MRADESRAPAILEIIVGHSTGGMYVLATPALEPLVAAWYWSAPRPMLVGIRAPRTRPSR
jgi:hypothetical protein